MKGQLHLLALRSNQEQDAHRLADMVFGSVDAQRTSKLLSILFQIYQLNSDQPVCRCQIFEVITTFNLLFPPHISSCV